jgi:hypothetical protein
VGTFVTPQVSGVEIEAPDRMQQPRGATQTTKIESAIHFLLIGSIKKWIDDLSLSHLFS